MRETYQYESDLLQSEGWEKREYWYEHSAEHGGKNPELSVGNASMRVTVEGFMNQGASPTYSPFRVFLSGHPSGDQVLIDSEPSVRYFRWQEYEALEALGPAESTAK